MIDDDFKNKYISLVIVSPGEIKEINKKYRDKDYVTDVLSFPLIEDEYYLDNEEIGEIFICYNKVYEQAKVLGHSIDLEWQVLFVHGMWHLLGYDHIEDGDYEVMSAKEGEVINLLKKHFTLI